MGRHDEPSYHHRCLLAAINDPQSELQHSLRASLGELIRHPHFCLLRLHRIRNT